MIKVSIIVPVYNVEKYLDKCLNSIINQSLKEIEILVINDGTLDNSQLIIDRYVKKYPKTIKSFKKENGGLGDARNFGLSKAKGDYILFVDSDDYLDKDYAKKLYISAIENKSQIVVCEIINVNEKNQKIILSKNNFYGTTNIFDNKEILFNKPAAWNKLYKKEIFNNKEFRYTSRVWYEDIRLTTKLFLKCTKITYINEPLYYYLIREGSIMNNKNIQKNYDIIDAFMDIIDYYKKEDEYNKFKDEIEFLAIDNIYISAVVRVICASKTFQIKENIKPLIDFFNNNFKLRNRYIRRLSMNKKITLWLIKHKQFIIVRMIFEVKRLL